jgi:hypothetical protein
MQERRLDSYEFYNGAEGLSFPVDRLFGRGQSRFEEVWVLVADDGAETEAILPVEEYKRLKAIERVMRRLKKKARMRRRGHHD